DGIRDSFNRRIEKREESREHQVPLVLALQALAAIELPIRDRENSQTAGAQRPERFTGSLAFRVTQWARFAPDLYPSAGIQHSFGRALRDEHANAIGPDDDREPAPFEIERNFVGLLAFVDIRRLRALQNTCVE